MPGSPLTNILIDNHGRQMTYLRLAVTDRCNLRCYYCMPEKGIQYTAQSNLLSYEEMVRLVKLLSLYGVNKLRITGGEPFLRKGLMSFIKVISSIDELSVHITSNGTLIRPHLKRLHELGIASINLSLDSLDHDRFQKITRRDNLTEVISALHEMLALQIPVKINMVVMNGTNIQDIAPMIELTRDNSISVRFLEEMPFNGSGIHADHGTWDHRRILDHLRSLHPNLITLPKTGQTAELYKVPGYRGTVGIIASYSRTFCGTCDRLRITPLGDLKTCLYDNGVMSLRDLMRQGASDMELIHAIQSAINHRAADGWEAEKRRLNVPVSESMATIGG
ncbi:MAG: GTP 3',8-cyclase MoaA [Bacteroidota bacterium]